MGMAQAVWATDGNDLRDRERLSTKNIYPLHVLSVKTEHLKRTGIQHFWFYKYTNDVSTTNVVYTYGRNLSGKSCSIFTNLLLHLYI